MVYSKQKKRKPYVRNAYYPNLVYLELFTQMKRVNKKYLYVMNLMLTVVATDHFS